MANIQDLKRRLAEIEARVREELPRVATVLTLSAKALAERRVKDQGFGEVYSINPLPVWFLNGKELNNAGKQFIEDDEDGLATWGEFRAAQGLQTSHVDLSYTNKMWANMQPGEVEVSGNIYFCPLVATNTEAQNKMNWNRDRYGDFIGKALRPTDFNLLAEVVITEITEIAQSIT